MTRRVWETERQRRCRDSDTAKWKSATLKTLLHQQSVTYRLTFKRASVRWKEQRDTERWASNCLTFLLAGGAETVGKDKLTLPEKKLNLILQAGSAAVAASSPLSAFGIFQTFGRIKVSAEA